MENFEVGREMGDSAFEVDFDQPSLDGLVKVPVANEMRSVAVVSSRVVAVHCCCGGGGCIDELNGIEMK